MAVFTTTPKNPLSWQSSVNNNVPTPTVFTSIVKEPLSFSATPVTVTENYYLLINDLYFLDIGNGQELMIQNNNGRENVTWNTTNKTQ
jgi:hypothetical protein